MSGETEQNVDTKKTLAVIDCLKKRVAADRCDYVKKKIEENKRKLIGITSQFCNLSNSRKDSAVSNSENLLTKRQQDAICMFNASELNNGEKENNGCEEDRYASSAVLLGASFGAKNVIPPIKLPQVNKLPPYTTWIFLDRNQRMPDDQSIVGRRRIYYDQNGGEALLCSDSEEEVVEDEEDKREFMSVEDYILRMTIQEVGSSDVVLESLAQCFSRKPCEVKERYDNLIKGEKVSECLKKGDVAADPQLEEAFLNKDLEAALDSFDNLFCRRCLVFDCRLHGCSQDLVFPVEKQLPWSPPDKDNEPCGSHCYRVALNPESIATVSSSMPDGSEETKVPSSGSAGMSKPPKRKAGGSVLKNPKPIQCESASSNERNASESSDSDIGPQLDSISLQCSSTPLKNKLVGKPKIQKRNSKRVAERALLSKRKKQKKLVASDSDSVASGCHRSRDMKLRSDSRKDSEDASSSSQHKMKSPISRKARKKDSPVDSDKTLLVKINGKQSDEAVKDPPMIGSDDTLRKEECVDENICKHEGDKSWKAIEKGLYTKGLEIFGRNSCLIARNLLSGMKTCSEIYQYMTFTENELLYGAGDGANSPVEGHSKGSELRTRSRFMRRKGKVRRLKYSWKSAAYNTIRKRITEKKDQPCRQYNPCGCQSACGKQCSCLINGTCCEKYCGCPKSCKFRFRGCHCAKSQCRSRQCPCFAANRECDPDVCRNCRISCGDGDLGGPSQEGDNYECRNMKLLLKQQQRVLLGRSDVSGWGAFLKNSVGKHEYLGEYTGELISHREADKRGKIYDRENSSFLFNLNDQFVLDAYRKGDKLKFANHSPNPNCYAKVLMVAGDHRVGIFAKERICAGEELFYDYRYEPDHAPAWARKPETLGARKDEVGNSSGRAKKLA
nr:CLF-like protein [Aquilegia coerulea]